MKTRSFSGTMSTYRSRFEGLSEEYYTIKSRWMHLRSILGDNNLLSDISKNVDVTLEWLLGLLEKKIEKCEKISKHAVDSTVNLDRDLELGRISDLLFLIARFLSYIKSAFYQRTVSLEIPYVIAGLPISPETRWGDESYLVAADNLIKNYSSHLDLHDFPWSGFTSYTPMHPLYRRFPGASYSNFSGMFHIALSAEMKYFLNGFLVLSHELGHATLESYMGKNGVKLMPEIMYRCLYVFYNARRQIYSLCLKGISRGGYCRDCNLRFSLQDLTRQGKKFRDFMDDSWDNPIVELINEIACDIIGMTISGPHYPRALFDYTFRGIVYSARDGELALNDDFERNFIRIAACYCFSKVRAFEWKSIVEKEFKGISMEAFSSIALLKEPNKKSFTKCIACLMRFGSTVGSIFSACPEFVLETAFKDMHDFDSVQFKPDPLVVNLVKEGDTVCSLEPRQIIHACLELMKDSYEEYPSALFSLANNSHASSKS